MTIVSSSIYNLISHWLGTYNILQPESFTTDQAFGTNCCLLFQYRIFQNDVSAVFGLDGG